MTDSPLPADLTDALRANGQDHLIAHAAEMSPAERAALTEQLRAIDLAELKQLHAGRDKPYSVPTADRIAPLPEILPDADDAEARAIGEAALAAGNVAVIIVAGGQGTRLGSDRPKGTFAVGPVSGASLFQIHAEKVLARQRRAKARLPLLVMTSDATHAQTEAFFHGHQFFGLPAGDVRFFRQGTMPAVDLETGRLLLERPGRLFTSPNGHGGTITALADSGLLAELLAGGVRHLFYFQVDNPLVKVACPVFLGRHIRAKSEVSSKVIAKDGPADKVGNFVLVDGRLAMIEYSDLPAELARQTDATGQLLIRAGNPAIHIFDLRFLERLTAGGALALPYHLARKKVPHYDPVTRTAVEPERENALKFERFIFDVLPACERYVAAYTSRADEFAPLKNATGPDSPATVRQAQIELHAKWLRMAGAVVPDGVPVEIRPTAAVEPGDVVGHVTPGQPIAAGFLGDWSG